MVDGRWCFIKGPHRASFPTLEHAELLSSRLSFIQDHLIDEKPFPNDLIFLIPFF